MVLRFKIALVISLCMLLISFEIDKESKLNASEIRAIIESQITNSGSLILGSFVGRVYKRLKGNTIVTEYTFKMSESIGLKNSDVLNRNNFKVLHMGGIWLGQPHKVSSLPTFQKDEEYAIFIKKEKNGFFFHDSKIGIYLIKKLGKERRVFPFRKKGKGDFEGLELEEFKAWAKSNLGKDFFNYNGQKYFVKAPKKTIKWKRGSRGRMPSSINGTETEKSEDDFDFFWPVLVFSLLGAYKIYINKRNI